MDKVANSKNDEFYTPKYAVKPIFKYIPKDKIVWCPFDTQNSNFVKMLKSNGNTVVKMLKSNGNTVIATHISFGYDFFEYSPKKYDYIVSNPPYSVKGAVLQRLFDLGKPFAMLIGVVGLFESQKRFEMFRDNDFEIMYLNRRVAYLKESYDVKPSLNPPFSSVYLCKNMLPKQIMFEDIIKKEL